MAGLTLTLKRSADIVRGLGFRVSGTGESTGSILEKSLTSLGVNSEFVFVVRQR